MEEILRSIPRITLAIITFSVCLSGLTSFAWVRPSSLALSLNFYKKYEVWRLFTSFLYYGKFGFGTSIQILGLFYFSKSLELSGSSQYLFFITLIYTFSLAICLFFELPFMSYIFHMALIYVISRRNRQHLIGIMGLPFNISASYLPYFLILIDFTYSKLIGMCLGHVYYYFEDIYPKLPHSRNYKLFNTPMIFFKISDFLRL